MKFGRETVGECLHSIWRLSLHILFVFDVNELVSGLLIIGFPIAFWFGFLSSHLHAFSFFFFTVTCRLPALAILSDPNFCPWYFVASCHWPAHFPRAGERTGQSPLPECILRALGWWQPPLELTVVSLFLLTAPAAQVSFLCFEVKFVPSFAS